MHSPLQRLAAGILGISMLEPGCATFLGGLAAAYDGYRAGLGNKTAPVDEGFSGDQQFFIAFGQAHKSKTRDAALRRQVMTDPHSPAEYRSLTARNIDAWYTALQVSASEKLYLAPEGRVRIW